MPRQAEHKETQAHPSPRFRDKVRLHRFLRSAADDIWHATFFLDGKWQTRKPVSLKTRDFDEACEVARDQYVTVAKDGLVAVQTRVVPPKPPKVEHPFRLYAEKAIATLEGLAAQEVLADKRRNHLIKASRIRNHLMRKWGEVDIRTITEHSLRDWIADEYRLRDGSNASASTLGNIDHAFLEVWNAAAAERVVERRLRPRIDKTQGEDAEPRGFIDQDGVAALAAVMTDEWVAKSDYRTDRFDPDHKRSFRCYVAMLATTGIRAGLEAKRVRIGDVKIGERSIVISIWRKQGKHGLDRSVVVLEAPDSPFPVRRLLRDQITRRKAQGASPTDPLFPWRDEARAKSDRKLWASVLKAAGATIDPLTGERRTAYSLRHYFATRLITRGLPVPKIAAWLGTSSAMVEANYNRFLLEREADQMSGYVPRTATAEPIPYDEPEPWRTPLDDAADEEIAPAEMGLN